MGERSGLINGDFMIFCGLMPLVDLLLQYQDCGKIEFLAKEVEAGSKKKPDTMIMVPASTIRWVMGWWSQMQKNRGG